MLNKRKFLIFLPAYAHNFELKQLLMAERVKYCIRVKLKEYVQVCEMFTRHLLFLKKKS
jgi:hypothetical protein